MLTLVVMLSLLSASSTFCDSTIAITKKIGEQYQIIARAEWTAKTQRIITSGTEFIDPKSYLLLTKVSASIFDTTGRTPEREAKPYISPGTKYNRFQVVPDECGGFIVEPRSL